ncbi:MAG: carbamoyltransferase [Myxococcales bacterium]|nr:carbamoyltransferase [Myxococcales bacterium]
MSRLVLGINSAHADSSAVLVSERGIEAAIAEERINRKKHAAGFPTLAVREVLRIAGASARDLTDVAVARDPRANLGAKLLFVARHPRSGIPKALARMRVHKEVASSVDLVAEALDQAPGSLRVGFHQVEHHLAHVASAFYGSSFERATGITADGAGDFATHLHARCEGLDIEVRGRALWPHSLGVYYTALCQFIGFDRFGEEYKVMGLSAYGVNRYARELRKVVRYDPVGGIRLDLDYFRHHELATGLEVHDEGEVSIPPLWGPKLTELFGPARARTEPIGDRERDLAASMQTRFEECYLELVDDCVRRDGCRDVVMAGGCVLNSVANGRLITERVVDSASFHPAASDDGTAAGAALYVMHHEHRVPRTGALAHAFLGTEWDEASIGRAVGASGMPHLRLERDALLDRAVGALAAGRIIGWFQGREEWGPRALGNRSILCNPSTPGMKATLNARIKNREPFRPFAPVVQRERLGECFRGEHEVPFMIVVYKVRPEWKERLAAVTHEDGTGRVQTVTRAENALYYDLIGRFGERTGVPVLLNTSFNENEPIVHTPEQALDCFRRTRMDALGIGPYWLEKPESERSAERVL